jgi:tetratricopeptide (TPR) repeat protein
MKMKKINKIVKTKTFVWVLVVAILIGGAYVLGKQQGSSDTKPEKLVTVADKYKEKLPALEAAVKKDSTDQKVRREYAIALYASGDLEKAKEQYLAELKSNDSDAVTYNNLGNIYRQQKKFDDAIQMYEKSIKLDEKNINAYLNLGHLYSDVLSKPNEAIRVYTDGLDKNPNDKTIQTQLALVYERSGDLEKAVEIYKAMLEQNANDLVAKEAIARLEKLL